MATGVKAEPSPLRATNEPQLWQGSASLCQWLSADLVPLGELEVTPIGLGRQERLVGSWKTWHVAQGHSSEPRPSGSPQIFKLCASISWL